MPPKGKASEFFGKVAMISNMVKFTDSGVELNSLLNTNQATRDAVLNYSKEALDKLATLENIEKDAKKGDITLAIHYLRKNPIVNEQDVVWSRVMNYLYELEKIHEMNDLLTLGVFANTLVSFEALKDGESFPKDYGKLTTLLGRACKDGNLRMFNMIMSHSPILNYRDDRMRYTNSLLIAIEYERIVIVKKLLEKGAKVDPRELGNDELRIASRKGNLNIFTMLIDHLSKKYNRGDIFEKNCKGIANVAVLYGRINILQYIVANGFSLQSYRRYVGRDEPEINDLMDVAAEKGNLEMIKFLISHNVQFSEPKLALHYPFNGKNFGIFGGERKDPTEETLQLIFDHALKSTFFATRNTYLNSLFKLESGRRPQPPGISGDITPLGQAIIFCPKVISCLIRMGCSRTDVCNSMTDYDYAIINSSFDKRYLESFEELVKHDTSSNIIISPQVLLTCIDTKSPDCIKILSKYGFRFNVPLKIIRSGQKLKVAPLSVYLEHPTFLMPKDFGGVKDCLMALLDSGCDPNYKADNFPPLFVVLDFYRVNKSSLDQILTVISLLMEHNADANLDDCFSKALMIGEKEIIKLLADNSWGDNAGSFDGLSDKFLNDYVFNDPEKLVFCIEIARNKEEAIELLRKSSRKDKHSLIAIATSNGFTRALSTLQ